ncbi:tryptophan-rich sensory protein [Patescibacteria group bacterium]|nr:tryptophan-rich sensory protein [Patescibacteria group bacterium]
MKIKPNYFLIPLITILVAVIGSSFTSSGMLWYKTTIIRPELTPPNWAFPIAWNLIFVCATISALIIYNKREDENFALSLLEKIINLFRHKKPDLIFRWIIVLFVINAILNVTWSLLFFNLHLIQASLAEMIALNGTTLALIILMWERSKTASLLLTPYAIWVGFATYLTYQIWILN